MQAPTAASPFQTAWHAACNTLEQPYGPSLREILGAYKLRGDGDREMLLAILGAKAAEDKRVAATASLHETMLQLHRIDPSLNADTKSETAGAQSPALPISLPAIRVISTSSSPNPNSDINLPRKRPRTAQSSPPPPPSISLPNVQPYPNPNPNPTQQSDDAFNDFPSTLLTPPNHPVSHYYRSTMFNGNLNSAQLPSFRSPPSSSSSNSSSLNTRSQHAMSIGTLLSSSSDAARPTSSRGRDPPRDRRKSPKVRDSPRTRDMGDHEYRVGILKISSERSTTTASPTSGGSDGGGS